MFLLLSYHPVHHKTCLHFVSDGRTNRLRRRPLTSSKHIWPCNSSSSQLKWCLILTHQPHVLFYFICQKTCRHENLFGFSVPFFVPVGFLLFSLEHFKTCFLEIIKTADRMQNFWLCQTSQLIFSQLMYQLDETLAVADKTLTQLILPHLVPPLLHLLSTLLLCPPPLLVLLPLHTAHSWILSKHLCWPHFSPLTISSSLPFVYQRVLTADPAALLSLHHLHHNCERPRTAGREESDVLTLIWWSCSINGSLLLLCNCFIAYLAKCLSSHGCNGRLTGQTHERCLKCK